MAKKREITVNDTIIRVVNYNNDDYISITDMLKAKEGDFFISDWLRNRNTVEFLSIWESINNPDFNYGESAIIKSQAGLNNYKISVKEWVEKANAVGLIAKAGRYGGTYAHKDIAFEFGTWISPAFKLYLIKEFQRLKEIESNTHRLEWNFRRSLSATNYRIHTDAIKEKLIPWGGTQQKSEVYIYAEEADLINLALFGLTAKQWREQYPEEAYEYKTIRDCADTHRLIVLSNLENLNAVWIRQGIGKKERYEMMREAAINQLASLQKYLIDPSTIESPVKKKILPTSELKSSFT
ncbi:KilA-N domain-containing protein [Chitinophaga sp. SYP-B3965]|uniref:KilA-N domain-containing protein n=1 Tax=Chitinophaga sp. SYP-B3965 TaxID=2663120 RepID=UPI001299A3CB|nr:KilA-N domain-containing protein [Chitinophaga sp. SYP-B3965]MRG48543.1 KilA-N domain-containing protein [Chitinophaga sp. SYP-B3965]